MKTAMMIYQELGIKLMAKDFDNALYKSNQDWYYSEEELRNEFIKKQKVREAIDNAIKEVIRDLPNDNILRQAIILQLQVIKLRLNL